MIATSSRRQLIVAILLSLAVVGAVMRVFNPASSLAYDIGTLLLVMWVPAVGNIIGFVIRRLRRPPVAAGGFEGPLTPHLRAALRLEGAREGEFHCALVVGSEAFSARAIVPGGQAPPGAPQVVALQLRAPAAGLARLRENTTFRVLVGRTIVGEGRVVEIL